MLSVSAWYLLKKQHIDLSQATFKVVLPVFVILSFTQVALFGANQAIEVTNYQPVKLAAMEGVWQSKSCAPMYLVGWVNETEQTTTGLSIPCLLSLLAYQDVNATVSGLDAFPADVWAPINLTFQVYHLMINLGGLFVLISILGALYFFRKRRIFETRWLLWLFVISILLTELATMSGWWTAEFGRQPWIVWNLLRTIDAVSPSVTGQQVAFSVGTFIVLYIILFILFIYLLNEKIQHGPEELSTVEEAPVTSLPDSFREIFGRPRA